MKHFSNKRSAYLFCRLLKIRSMKRSKLTKNGHFKELRRHYWLVA